MAGGMFTFPAEEDLLLLENLPEQRETDLTGTINELLIKSDPWGWWKRGFFPDSVNHGIVCIGRDL